MNVTAFLAGLAVALGYYLYTVYQERSNSKRKVMSDEQGMKVKAAVFQPERGERG